MHDIEYCVVIYDLACMIDGVCGCFARHGKAISAATAEREVVGDAPHAPPQATNGDVVVEAMREMVNDSVARCRAGRGNPTCRSPLVRHVISTARAEALCTCLRSLCPNPRNFPPR